MQSETAGTSRGNDKGSTRLLSTEELFEGLNELYESNESEFDAELASSSTAGPATERGGHTSQAAHLEITESGDAFNVRAELPSFDLREPAPTHAVIHAAARAVVTPKKTRRKDNPVLRTIDLLADADRENITATLRGGMLEVKLPKGRVESLAAARSALLASVVSGRPRGA